jgi:hypothetical protein
LYTDTENTALTAAFESTGNKLRTPGIAKRDSSSKIANALSDDKTGAFVIRRHHLAIASLALACIAFVLFFTSTDIQFGLGLNNTNTSNYENVTVWTRVNVTNSKPEVLSVIVYDSLNASTGNVTVTAGALRLVHCNSTIRDWNGADGNLTMNATFYANSGGMNFVDDNSSHYTNVTCVNVTGGYGQNSAYQNWSCGFWVRYYAINGTWNCTVNMLDSRENKNFSVYGTNSTRINRLYALNITDGIDYGDMAVGEFSSLISANISNFGNMNINVTVQGYGRNISDGFALVCNGTISTTNISIGSQAFSSNASGSWYSLKNMTGSSQLIANLTVPKRTDPTMYVVNNTYWQLYINPNENPFGVCTGNIIFAAIAP